MHSSCAQCRITHRAILLFSRWTCKISRVRHNREDRYRVSVSYSIPRSLDQKLTGALTDPILCCHRSLPIPHIHLRHTPSGTATCRQDHRWPDECTVSKRVEESVDDLEVERRNTASSQWILKCGSYGLCCIVARASIKLLGLVSLILLSFLRFLGLGFCGDSASRPSS